MRDDVRRRPRRVLHVDFDRLRAQDVLPLPVLKLLRERVERRDVVVTGVRLIGDVEEAPRHLIVDARVDRDLLPQFERLHAVAQQRPPFELARPREPVHRVHKVDRVDVVVAVRRAEADATEQVAVRAPQHDRVVRHRVPLDSTVADHARQHQPEPHEGVEQRVGPQRRLPFDHPVVDDRVVDDCRLTQPHERFGVSVGLLPVRPDNFLRQRCAFRDRPVDRRRDADVSLHHLLKLALQARDAAPIHRHERQVRVSVGQASPEVTRPDDVRALRHLLPADDVAPAVDDRSYHVRSLLVVDGPPSGSRRTT